MRHLICDLTLLLTCLKTIEMRPNACGCRSREVCGVHEEVEPAPVVAGRGRVHHQKRGPLLDLRDLHSSGSGDCQR